MLIFLKILFFGGVTTLTPNSINLGDKEIRLALKEPIEAITSGASIIVDVSEHINAKTVTDAFKEIDIKYPNGCIVAKLISNDSKEIILSESSGAWANDNISIHLRAKNGIPTDLEFNLVEIKSCKSIVGTNLKWRNYTK